MDRRFLGSWFTAGVLVLTGAGASCSGGADAPGDAPVERELSSRPAPEPGGVLDEIDYLGGHQAERGKGAARRQTLDLYLPEATPEPAPLLVFVHGGFWTLDDDDPRYRIGPGLARVLRDEGVAVALVRYRLAPEHPHPAAAEDVAAAAAYLVRSAPEYGYDPERIVLAGHSAGAHLAALVALDPRYLTAHELGPDALAGVVALSGLYDVTAPTPTYLPVFGPELTEREAASPLHHARADTPPFLVVAGTDDLPGFVRRAKGFERALRNAGNERTELRVLPEHDHFSSVRIGAEDHPLRALLSAFLRGRPLPPQAPFERRDRGGEEKNFTWGGSGWMEPFWKHRELIEEHPVDAAFLERIDFFFGGPEWREDPSLAALEEARTFHAIDLFDYLATRPADERGSGDFLVARNQRDEQLVWTRAQLEKHRPLLVVGIGEHRDLFHFTFSYRAKMEYTWRTDLRPPPEMTRPIGAFVYFPGEVPKEMRPRMLGEFSMLPHSFRWVERDPYGPIRDLPPELYDVVTYRNGCVYCHSLRGVGTRAFHTTTRAATPHGGFALPLVDYPEDVWERFVFRQLEAADLIGVSTPNVIEGDVGPMLYELVREEREPR